MIGIGIFQWLKLLYFNGFDIQLKHLPKVLGITFINFFLYPFIIYEKIRFGKKIENTKIEKDPIFIVGHWRSGTTHLHKILSKDRNLGFITLTETSVPSLMLGNSKLIHALMKPITPKKRATDNVEMFPEMPHEHEFALTFLSLLSPILGITFPKKFHYYRRYITFEGVPEKKIKLWKESFVHLIKKLTIKSKGKQLIMKNPLDTCRIEHILKLFPNAKFIHIYRNPYETFFSSLKLHKVNSAIYAMQKADYNLNELVLENFNEMYNKFYEDVKKIPEGNFVEVKYEDLRKDPFSQLEKIYSTLSLDGLEDLKRNVQPYLESVANFKPSTYKISPDDKKMIYSSWQSTIDKWGYEKASKK